ncbi:hypothetical protein QN372_05970 [Undibacterium sp. RTI2.1]|uniref:hypothetical protein n=1 Tax=unclassified Undibacterium TaxID=2630295 RepID=UPI002AB3A600|nr:MULTISPECIES: hypothetical protein [unclassified Undibacterium]MDY7538647.1 hypothetical protein [Undibacterium sp. 5I1]MEB0030284.1 hypothetical protein [Undibacterium sp. RTI2.1]MEB0116908.1 hypothetical protein [Undibacterium sp. RTI2.2]MEB0232136.1 hypothetical protein [Undibacterium sp. 10I3]MEB0259450.1 hypothetical protein [Undibacterium sp. 5I1]
MGLLILLFLAVIYVLLVSLLISYIKPWWLRPFVAIIFIAIPTADAVYGRYRLHQMCDAEGGLRIFRVVENVPGFYDPTSSPSEENVRKYGYRFSEGLGADKKIARLSLGSDGAIETEIGDKPVSKYIYQSQLGDLNGKYSRVEQRIVVIETGEILSRAVNINFEGGWVERLLAALYDARGSAGNCGSTITSDLFTNTLKPIKPTK